MKIMTVDKHSDVQCILMNILPMASSEPMELNESKSGIKAAQFYISQQPTACFGINSPSNRERGLMPVNSS